MFIGEGGGTRRRRCLPLSFSVVPGNSGGVTTRGRWLGAPLWASGSLDRNGHVVFPILGMRPSPSRVGFWQSHGFKGLSVKNEALIWYLLLPVLPDDDHSLRVSGEKVVPQRQNWDLERA